MSLILHYHPLSSYCWKALIGLHERGVAFEPRLVNLGDADARAAFAALWPTAKIPLLEDTETGEVVPETSIMLERIDDRGTEGAPLLPPDIALDVRLWDRLFDLYVMTPMQKIVGDRLRPAGGGDPHGVGEAHALLQTAYAMIEDRMADRAWACGDRFTLADCAAAPALFYATTVAPAEGRPRLTAYLDRLVALPSFTRVLEDARPYFRFFPYAERLPSAYRASS